MKMKIVIIAAFALAIVSCGGNGQPGADKSKDSTVQSKAETDSLIADSLAVLHGSVKADGYYYNIDLDEVPASLEAFVPAGYIGLDTVSGDLNGDQYLDIIMVLRQPEEDNLQLNTPDDPMKRPMLILLGEADSSYKLAANNDNAILCFYCGGMGLQENPYEKTVIKNGYFSIEYNTGTRVENTHHVLTFKYSPADSTWLLHRDGSETQVLDENSKYKTAKTIIRTSKDFGKITFEAFDIYKD